MEVMKDCVHIDMNGRCCLYKKQSCVVNEELCRFYKEF